MLAVLGRQFLPLNDHDGPSHPNLGDTSYSPGPGHRFLAVSAVILSLILECIEGRGRDGSVKATDGQYEPGPGKGDTSLVTFTEWSCSHLGPRADRMGLMSYDAGPGTPFASRWYLAKLSWAWSRTVCTCALRFCSRFVIFWSWTPYWHATLSGDVMLRSIFKGGKMELSLLRRHSLPKGRARQLYKHARNRFLSARNVSFGGSETIEDIASIVQNAL